MVPGLFKWPSRASLGEQRHGERGKDGGSRRPRAGEQSQEDMELQRVLFSRSTWDRRGDAASPHWCQPVSQDHSLRQLQHNQCQERASALEGGLEQSSQALINLQIVLQRPPLLSASRVETWGV